jgi:hypothetical protein
MKKNLLLVLVLVSLSSLNSYAQKKEKAHFVLNPLEVKMHKINNTKSGNYNLLKSINSPSYEIMFSYGSGVDQLYSSYLYSNSEVYTDYSDPSNNYRASYTYDSNQYLSRISIDSWVNNSWKLACYEQYAQDSTGRWTRTVASDSDHGFVVRAIGYYTYSQNRISEYIQTINIGGNVFDTLYKLEYYYNNNNVIDSCIESDYNNGEWGYAYKNDFIYDEVGVRLNIITYSFNQGQWINDSKYEWVYNHETHSYGVDNTLYMENDIRVMQRNYYLTDNSNNWTSQAISRYNISYDTSSNANYPIYPTISVFFEGWEKWFDIINTQYPIAQDERWRENNNTGMLSYVETSTYNYEEVVLGINNIEKQNENISVYPNPTNDILNIEVQENSKPLQITLYNTLGKEVMRTNLSSSQINIANLPQGLYLLNISSNGKILNTEKIVKK